MTESKSKKILIINNDSLPIEDFDRIAVISTRDISRIAETLEKELPPELKGATNAVVLKDDQQVQKQQSNNPYIKGL